MDQVATVHRCTERRSHGNERFLTITQRTLFGLTAPTISIYPSSLAAFTLALCRNGLAKCSLLCDVRESGCFQESTTHRFLVCRLGIQPLSSYYLHS